MYNFKTHTVFNTINPFSAFGFTVDPCHTKAAAEWNPYDGLLKTHHNNQSYRQIFKKRVQRRNLLPLNYQFKLQ